MPELCLFLLVLNFDTFLTGLAFGVAGIMMTWGARAVIGACSAGFFGLAMWLGGLLPAVLPLESLQALASLVLLGCTLALVIKYCGRRSRGRLSGLWQRPAGLDSNADKRISPGEAVLLGVALALDTVAGGLAFGILDENALLGALLSGVICFVLLSLSNDLGHYTMRNLRG